MKQYNDILRKHWFIACTSDDLKNKPEAQNTPLTCTIT